MINKLPIKSKLCYVLVTKKTILISLLIVFFLSLIIGCGNKKPNEIKVGVLYALSGPYAPVGERAKKGTDLALEEINKESINGQKIQLIYEDTSGDPQKAVNAFNKLIEINKVNYILGPLSSAETLAIAPIANKKKIIILTPSSTAPQITDAGDYIFRNCVSDIFEGKIAAEYIANIVKAKKIALLYLNNDFGIGIKEAFSNRLNELNGNVSIIESFNSGDVDFKTQLTKIKSKNPDLILLVGYPVGVGKILKQAKELGVKAKYFSFSNFESPDVIKEAGETANGVTYTYQGFDVKNDEEIVNTFLKSYQSKYKEDPDLYAALSYDALKIYAEAFKNGGADVESIKTALYKIKDFTGVVGKTSFDGHGDVIKPIGIKKVENGKFVWVKKNYIAQ